MDQWRKQSKQWLARAHSVTMSDIENNLSCRSCLTTAMGSDQRYRQHQESILAGSKSKQAGAGLTSPRSTHSTGKEMRGGAERSIVTLLHSCSSQIGGTQSTTFISALLVLLPDTRILVTALSRPHPGHLIFHSMVARIMHATLAAPTTL